MLSTCMNVKPKQGSNIRKKASLSLIFVLFLIATVAWNKQQQSLAREALEEGPWQALANIPACATQGRVCAEWPLLIGTVPYVAVCCIDPSDLGSAEPPDVACPSGGMIMLRRGDEMGDAW